MSSTEAKHTNSRESSANSPRSDGSSPRHPASQNQDDVPEGESKLHNKYTLWYYRRSNHQKTMGYEESIRKIDSFNTVEHFWRVYNHVQRPNDIKNTTDFHMFKDGIKPMWEDAMNRDGGKCMVKVKKGLTSMYWEDLLLAMIGEQFDVGQEICGAVVSIRGEHDIISVWNKSSNNVEATNKIRDQIRRILKLPAFVPVEYKKHQECLTDQSSYRNPSAVWKPNNGQHQHQQSSRNNLQDNRGGHSGGFTKHHNQQGDNTDGGVRKWNKHQQYSGEGAGEGSSSPRSQGSNQTRSLSGSGSDGSPTTNSTPSPRGNWRNANANANNNNNNNTNSNSNTTNNNNNNNSTGNNSTASEAPAAEQAAPVERKNFGSLVRDQLAALGGGGSGH